MHLECGILIVVYRGDGSNLAIFRSVIRQGEPCRWTADGVNSVRTEDVAWSAGLSPLPTFFT